MVRFSTCYLSKPQINVDSGLCLYLSASFSWPSTTSLGPMAHSFHLPPFFCEYLNFNPLPHAGQRFDEKGTGTVRGGLPCVSHRYSLSIFEQLSNLRSVLLIVPSRQLFMWEGDLCCVCVRVCVSVIEQLQCSAIKHCCCRIMYQAWIYCVCVRVCVHATDASCLITARAQSFFSHLLFDLGSSCLSRVEEHKIP